MKYLVCALLTFSPEDGAKSKLINVQQGKPLGRNVGPVVKETKPLGFILLGP